MIRNYLKSALRNFLKHRSFTLLNVAGLSLGLAASILILQYVKYEKSYDTFHSNVENIYRVQYNVIQNGKVTVECAAAVPAVGPALKDNFPEVRQFTRLFPVSGVLSYESPARGFISFREEKMQITDPAVFEVFDFKLIEGNPVTCLEGPNKVVITKRAVEKYFGEENPMGKTLSWDGEMDFEVTGILENVPGNSHIKFDILFSYQTLNDETENASETSWGWYDFNTYVLVDEKASLEDLQSKWDNYLEEERGEDWQNHYRQEFILRPLKDIHLYSNLLQESEPDEQGDGDAVYFLTIIAFFILVIAWVNYVNLSTAKSFERANEVGVRKVMGAEKGQLVKQFMAESFLINLLAAAVAVLLVRLCWPSFADLSGRSIPIDYIVDGEFWGLVTVLFLIGTLLSGSYPAMVLSSFRPVAVLKGKIMRTSGGNLMRKSLVVFQFASSVILVCGTVIVYQQLNYMKNRDLGIDINQTLVLEGPGITDSLYEQNLESFKLEALNIAGVKQVTAATNVPGDEIFWTRSIRRLQGGPESAITVYNVGIDHDYVPAFDLKVTAGRNFSEEFPNDRERILLNTALAEALEFDELESAIGQQVRLGRDTFEIAGVLENYHQMSLKSQVAPLAFRLVSSSSFYSFKIEPGTSRDVLAGLQEPWNTFFPGNPVDYFFLDSFFNKQYEKDRQFGQVFGLFSLLAIFVASLGLFGLASFLTLQRTKEIGIRKVLGSTVPNIVLLLSKDFIQLVILSNLLAWPLAWWLMDSWLQSFPYRIALNPLLFLGAGISVVLVAFLSVGVQTLKAALLNPAETLKYE
ncbi:MAG: ABC transporter permease [Cytophagales bacterium]|nr:ABC transporter permease [Cytophagales bacterium]